MNAARITTLAYASRHIQPYVTNAEWGNISAVAQADKSTRGRVRITNQQIADQRGRGRARGPLSERTVRVQMHQLCQDGRWLKREGWTVIVVGAEKHTVETCDHPQCVGDRQAVAELAAADELAARRREKARLKKARQREARKAAQIV